MDTNILEDNQTKLGIFDSGIGGFSVLKEIRDKTPVDVLYFGDCARAPYGNRSIDEISLFIREIILSLQGQEVTHFVSACNSMSVMTTNKLLESCGVDKEKYVDMLRAFKDYSNFPNNARVLVIGTQVTIQSGAYQEVLIERNIDTHEYIFKTLAGLIEKGVSGQELEEIVTVGMEHAKEIGATHIVYGCTHYPLIDDVFRRCSERVNWGGEFVDPALYVAEVVAKWNLRGEKNTFFEASEVTPAFSLLSTKYSSNEIE